jgi:hypothetical protein
LVGSRDAPERRSAVVSLPFPPLSTPWKNIKKFEIKFLSKKTLLGVVHFL